MKQKTSTVILLLVLTFLVLGVNEADAQVREGILSRPHAMFTGTTGPSVQMNGDVNIQGNVSATSFTGSGAGLTGIPGTAISNTSITVNQIQDNAVSAAKITDSAVTPGKISFYGNVRIVAKTGGDFPDPYAAMSTYSSWCPSSFANPCLLKIMPGVYDVGTSSVIMQPYIDIEGSGEDTTIIQGNIDSLTAGVVNGANNSELRFLTVKNIGGGGYATAIYNYNTSASSKITNVTANASGGSTGSSTTYGVYNSHSSPLITNVSAISGGSAQGNYGVYNYYNSSPTMTNVTATASGISHSSNYGVYNYSYCSPAMSNVSAIASGGANSHGIYNSTTAAYSPTMTNVIATGMGGSISNSGITNSSSSPAMTNITATASGGYSSVGVDNDASSPTMTNVTATASGGSPASYGVNNNGSSTIMTNVTATALGNIGYGIYISSGTVKINHSVIKGNTNTIYNESSGTTYVGDTQLDGGAVSNSGTITCVGVYDTNYVALGGNCQ